MVRKLAVNCIEPSCISDQLSVSSNVCSHYWLSEYWPNSVSVYQCRVVKAVPYRTGSTVYEGSTTCIY